MLAMTPSRHYLRFMCRFSTAAASSGVITKARSKLHYPDNASVTNNSSSPLSSFRYDMDHTVRRLAKSQRFSDIESLIESHKKNPKIKSEPFLSILIRSYGRAAMFDHAIKTFEEMDRLGTPRSVVSFNALLAACLNSHLFERVPQLFDEIPQRYSITPNMISYGMLIKSYCDSGSPTKAMEIIRDMEDKGVEITIVSFTTILGSLYKNNQIDEAESLWTEMVKKGCELDNTVYNVRLMNAAKESPERVKELMEEMISVGLKPDTVSYNYLMTAYCKKKMMNEAKKVYEGLVMNNCCANAATFRTLLFHLCINGLYDQGLVVFKKSAFMGKIPDFKSCKHLTEGLVKNNRIEDARGVGRTVKKIYPPRLVTEWKILEATLGLYSASSPSQTRRVFDREREVIT